MKNAPRGLEGTFRSAAEMERHRAQMADAAIEEQLEVQTAFRYFLHPYSSAFTCFLATLLFLSFAGPILNLVNEQDLQFP